MNQYRQPFNSGNPNEIISWLVIVAALSFCFPVGLFLLFRKITRGSNFRSWNSSSGRSFDSRSTTYHYSSRSTGPSQPGGTAQPGGEYHYRYASAAQGDSASARPNSGGFQPPSAGAAPAAERLPNGRGMMVGGGILAGVFALALLSTLIDAIAYGDLFWSETLISLSVLTTFFGVGVVLFSGGVFRRRQSRRFRKYLALIGRREAVSVSTLAKATGWKHKKVCDDLQTMLDRGILPVGYLDLANDRLVLSGEGIADDPEPEPTPEPEAPAEEPPQDAARSDNDILLEIKEINDQIADSVMSAKIDRIGEITSRILDDQRKKPRTEGQLRSFLSYDLPTTLKILRAYAQLEEQGIEGENISAAKSRIEGMMDKVVEGFENQLDKLFQDDALDITAYVAVLEKMLDHDGLTPGNLTQGG